MAYDPAATKAKFLDAAFAEFVEHGLAGARVDRIAAAAGANKQAIYAYFGSKEALFDAVLGNRLGILADAVPLTPDDLPGYAAALFDYLLDNPGYMRLTMWKRLERPHASAEEVAAYSRKVGQLEAALALDRAGPAAIDLVMLAISAASAWAMTTPEIRNLDPGAASEVDRLARHRRTVVASMSAALAALTAPGRATGPEGIPRDLAGR
jgi:AcrR family transcriptional regulator